MPPSSSLSGRGSSTPAPSAFNPQKLSVGSLGIEATSSTPATSVKATKLKEEENYAGWVKTWTWTLGGAVVFVGASALLQIVLPNNPAAHHELLSKVPIVVYQMSATAFFTAFVLNLTSVVFEDSASKRQLALLSCAIKGAACYADLTVVTGSSNIAFDYYGAIVMPQRYAQWLVTTPTLVYVLSKISDFNWHRTTQTIVCDMVMIVMGLCANFMPAPWIWLAYCGSCCFFVNVMYQMGCMVYSAIREHTNSNSKRSLTFIYMCTLVIWSLFPVAWLMGHLFPRAIYQIEMLHLFANFTSKILFSSSIMYGNYMTIAQRRLGAQKESENRHRIQMVTDLKEAVTRKDQFMSLMSHELRTPLNGIIQLSDALVRGAGGEMNQKGQHFTKTIKNSSNHLLNIINDILDVAALKEGKLTIKHELCSVAKAVDHVVDIVAPLAKKDVVIEKMVDPKLPAIIADASRVIQILYNLLGNSLKFTHKGKVAVHAKLNPAATAVIIEVIDTGIGIPNDRIGSIFGAFEQVDMSVTRKYGGTGLGLNIVKQLVDAHAGVITVESREGEGTTFTVQLPVMQHNPRKSLEIMVLDVYESLGYNSEKLVPPSRTSLSAGRGLRRRPSAVRALMEKLKGQVSEDGTSGSSPERTNSGGDKLLRKKTFELERENMMGDIMRRTEHKKSMDESELASRQLRATEAQQEAPGTLDLASPAAGPRRSSMDRHRRSADNHMRPGASDLVMTRNGSVPLPSWPGPGAPSPSSRAGPAAKRSSFTTFLAGAQDGESAYSMRGQAVSMSGRQVLVPPSPGARPSMFGNGGRTPPGSLLYNKAMESDLYRYSGDGSSFAGGDSDSDGPFVGGKQRPRSAMMSARSIGGVKPGSPRAGDTIQQGVSLDKTAYSDIHGATLILSVDDEEVNQIVLEEILTSSGYIFARCMDGLEALEWLKESPYLPDLILLDCMMPNMSGHEFCKALRGEYMIPGNMLPVIMVSAKSDEENIVEGLRSGSNDFVRKPYQREELMARIDAQLRAKQESWWSAAIHNKQSGAATESMKLLKNILPESVILRMQEGQKYIADSHPNVVIMFSDIVGFTNLSSKWPTGEVFMMLSNMFSAFDKLTDKWKVYKVETIGDAYMVAAGHDEDDESAARGTPLERMMGMAQSMLGVVSGFTAPNKEKVRIRIGMHCGPAFAGVIGTKCPRFCFLGDTVNTASRMETTGFPMCVHVSAAVAAEASEHSPFELVDVGEREVKGKGKMNTYLVKTGQWEQALQVVRERQADAAGKASGGGTPSGLPPPTGRSSGGHLLQLQSLGESLQTVLEESCSPAGTPVGSGRRPEPVSTALLPLPPMPAAAAGNAETQLRHKPPQLQTQEVLEPSYSSTLSPSSSGMLAAPGHPTVTYFEERITSLRSQLQAEQALRTRLQAELDCERQRATDAQHTSGALQHQLSISRSLLGAATSHPDGVNTPTVAAAGPQRTQSDMQESCSFASGDADLAAGGFGAYNALHNPLFHTTGDTNSGSGAAASSRLRTPSNELWHAPAVRTALRTRPGPSRVATTSSLGLPLVTLASLLREVGLGAHLSRFQSEAIHLDMLLVMDNAQLELLGLRPYGHCMRLREAVTELARRLLRRAEDAALAQQAAVAALPSSSSPVPALAVPHNSAAVADYIVASAAAAAANGNGGLASAEHVPKLSLRSHDGSEPSDTSSSACEVGRRAL